MNGGLANNGIICETNGTAKKIGACNAHEWCISNSWDTYSTRLSTICKQGNHIHFYTILLVTVVTVI